jgi:hypothetical protein
LISQSHREPSGSFGTGKQSSAQQKQPWSLAMIAADRRALVANHSNTNPLIQILVAENYLLQREKGWL